MDADLKMTPIDMDNHFIPNGVIFPPSLEAGTCTDDDKADIKKHWDDFNSIVQNCGYSCALKGGPCVTSCVEQKVGLSPGCAGCFGAEADCGKKHCLR